MAATATTAVRKYYTNILKNGDIEIGYITINGKNYRQFIEEDTRFKYVLDTHTNNLSFSRTAKDLYNLGIQNYRFMLKLYDPNLIGVNPYSNMLTAEQIKRITIECKRNIWYFLREVARLPVEGGALGPGAGLKYQLNRGNLAATWCFINNIDHYLVLPRQIGKTKSTLENILWAFLFSSNTKMMFLNKDGIASKANLKSLKDQKDLLPMWMQSKFIYNDDGEKKTAKGDNATYLEHPHNQNRITAFAGGTSIDAADRCGRGLTQAIQYCDEVEFTRYIKTIIDAAGPAFGTASRNAKANGAPYCRIFTTTPGNMDSEPVATTVEFRKQMMRFSESLYDRTIEDAKEIIDTNSAIDIVYIEYSYIELGKDEKWFIETAKKVSNDKIKIRREILLKRIRGSSTSPFEAEDLEEIANLIKTPIEEIYINKIYPMYVYEKLNRNVPYIVGVDVASGRAGDYSAVTILDPYTIRPVADFRSNITTTPKLVSFLMSLVTRYIPRAILTIENNNMGSSVIDMLRTSPISGNLYFDNNKFFIPDATQRLDAKGFAILDAKNSRSYGINTNPKTRDIMYNILFNQVREHKGDFVTKFIGDDLNALVRNPAGRVAAANGSHDDSMMSYLIALFTFFHGSNLARYGYSRGDSAPESEREKTRQEYFEDLPDELRDYFGPVMSMQTSEEHDLEMRIEADRQRDITRVQRGANGAMSENVDFEVDEESGIAIESGDVSWLDDLNK